VRRFAALWGLALFLLFVLVVFRAVILPFVLGVLVAYVLGPVVGGLSQITLRRRKVPRGVAILCVYVGLAAAIGVFFTTFLPHLSSDFARLLHEAPRFFSDVRHEYLPRADAWLEQAFPREAPEVAEPRVERKLKIVEKKAGEYELSLDGLQLEVQASGKGRWVIGPRPENEGRDKTRLSDLLLRVTRSTETEFKGVLEVGQRFVASVVKGFAWFVLTFMVAAYLLADLDRVMEFFRSLVPEPHRPTYDELLAEIDRGLSGVIRGQLLICVVNGVLSTCGLLLFRVKYPLLLGMVAGAMSFIPVFGSILSSVPIVTVALASGPSGFSLTTGLGMLGWIVGIHFLEANLFNPKIIGTAAKIHPVVVVFSLMVGEETGGLIGALLAVPVASIVQAVFLHLRKRARAAAAFA
jgi:predicted PurR-regulated permease PerM